MREICPDPTGWLTSLRIDVDASDAATRWIDAGLPQPSLIVVRKNTKHAHYNYLLKTWVMLANPKTARYAKAVRDALTAAVAGDAAYSGTFTHNPFNDAFQCFEGRPAFDLDELATHVDLFDTTATSPHTIRVEPPEGRNHSLFSEGRLFAYQIVCELRKTGEYDKFADRVLEFLVAQNARFAIPLMANEVGRIAKSISRWTWRFYAKTTPMRRPRYATDRKSYLARSDDRRTSSVALASQGLSPKLIAVKLGISRRTVERYLSASSASDSINAASIVAAVNVSYRSKAC